MGQSKVKYYSSLSLHMTTFLFEINHNNLRCNLKTVNNALNKNSLHVHNYEYIYLGQMLLNHYNVIHAHMCTKDWYASRNISTAALEVEFYDITRYFMALLKFVCSKLIINKQNHILNSCRRLKLRKRHISH